MYENLIFPLVVILFLIFIIIVPWLLCKAIRKIASPVPSWFPLPAAVVVLLVMGGTLQFKVIDKANVLVGTLVMFSFMLLLITLAVITPYLWFGKKTEITRPWLAFSLLTFIGAALMFYSTMGHSFEGRPLPPFTPALPLAGWFLDGLAAIFNLQEIVYSPALPVHTLLTAFGIYLQALIIAAVYFGLLSPRSFAGNE
ncbi:MAG: hypothetical protein M0Q92_04325 [Methanoregula sp.]|jgi:hypothetical protein|nr:hypothetical protein [Methanoregula sp.]